MLKVLVAFISFYFIWSIVVKEGLKVEEAALLIVGGLVPIEYYLLALYVLVPESSEEPGFSLSCLLR